MKLKTIKVFLKLSAYEKLKVLVCTNLLNIFRSRSLLLQRIAADLAVDAFLHSVAENQHIKGLIQHPHHHGLRVQGATFLWRTNRPWNKLYHV